MRRPSRRAGSPSFVRALRSFAASEGRELAALREAAKRSHGWLDQAQRALAARRVELGGTLEEARGRLQAVRNSAEAEAAKVRAKHAEFQAAVGRTSEERKAAAEKLAVQLRKQLRGARRRWIRRGDFEQLSGSVAGSLRSYADAVESLCRDTNESLQESRRGLSTRSSTRRRVAARSLRSRSWLPKNASTAPSRDTPAWRGAPSGASGTCPASRRC